MIFNNDKYLNLADLITSINDHLKKLISRKLKDYNLTFAQYCMILTLVEKDGISQTELSIALGWDRTNIMVVCDSLEKKGAIVRKGDPKDRRINIILITEKGKSLYEQSHPEVIKLMKNYKEVIKDDEVDIITPYLDKINTFIKSKLEEVNN